jgi:hypothetical protein
MYQGLTKCPISSKWKHELDILRYHHWQPGNEGIILCQLEYGLVLLYLAIVQGVDDDSEPNVWWCIRSVRIGPWNIPNSQLIPDK